MEKTLGRYNILKKIGMGGMGVVYKGFDPNLDRTVAIKTLLPQIALNPDAYKRFMREAKSNAKLNHKNIVTIYDFGKVENTCFIVMDYIEGASLETFMQKRTFTIKEICKIIIDILRALQYSHEKGIIHRDIKPANILIGKKGRVVVTDFGLAKAINHENEKDKISLSGTVIGTPAYMSPEQANGIGVDHQSDLFSVGVILYEMLTGTRPFEGEAVLQILNNLATVEPPDVHTLNEGVPLELSQICRKALEKEKKDRYETAKDLLQDIVHFYKLMEANSDTLAYNGPTLVINKKKNKEAENTKIKRRVKRSSKTIVRTKQSKKPLLLIACVFLPIVLICIFFLNQQTSTKALFRNLHSPDRGVQRASYKILLKRKLNISELRDELFRNDNSEAGMCKLIELLVRKQEKKSFPILVKLLEKDLSQKVEHHIITIYPQKMARVLFEQYQKEHRFLSSKHVNSILKMLEDSPFKKHKETSNYPECLKILATVWRKLEPIHSYKKTDKEYKEFRVYIKNQREEVRLKLHQQKFLRHKEWWKRHQRKFERNFEQKKYFVCKKDLQKIKDGFEDIPHIIKREDLHALKKEIDEKLYEVTYKIAYEIPYPTKNKNLRKAVHFWNLKNKKFLENMKQRDYSFCLKHLTRTQKILQEASSKEPAYIQFKEYIDEVQKMTSFLYEKKYYPWIKILLRTFNNKPITTTIVTKNKTTRGYIRFIFRGFGFRRRLRGIKVGTVFFQISDITTRGLAKLAQHQYQVAILKAVFYLHAIIRFLYLEGDLKEAIKYYNIYKKMTGQFPESSPIMDKIRKAAE